MSKLILLLIMCCYMNGDRIKTLSPVFIFGTEPSKVDPEKNYDVPLNYKPWNSMRRI